MEPKLVDSMTVARQRLQQGESVGEGGNGEERERERGGSVWEKGEMGEERGREVCEREGGMGVSPAKALLGLRDCSTALT